MTSISMEPLLMEEGGVGKYSRPTPPRGAMLFGGKVDELVHENSVAQAHVSIRLGFIRKVFGILGAQLLFTTIIAAVFIYTPGLKGLVQQWSWMPILGMFLSIGLLIAMLVKRHESPTNFILLFLWTVVEAYTVGTITSFYDVDVVVQAFFLTSGVVLALTVYAFQTKRDFSSWGAGLFAVLWVMVIGSVLQLFLMNATFDFLLACGGAILFSMFIIFDLHMLMHHMSPEEYILATINLYLDIINLFLHILRILQASRRE